MRPCTRIPFLAIAYGFVEGLTPVPRCAGLYVDIASAQLAALLQADSEGTAWLDVNLPPLACDLVRVQAVDVGACAKTNINLTGSATKMCTYHITLGGDVCLECPFAAGYIKTWICNTETTALDEIRSLGLTSMLQIIILCP